MHVSIAHNYQQKSFARLVPGSGFAFFGRYEGERLKIKNLNLWRHKKMNKINKNFF
jgi:hypothetical protein